VQKSKTATFGSQRLPMINAVLQIQKAINELYNKKTEEKK
jgi:hypothetical protein